MKSRQVTSELQVSADGLRVESGWCESVAARLAGNSVPTGVGSLWLASAAAVNVSNAQVAAAAIRCTFRLQATATKLGAAASSYSANEAGSAAELQTLNKPMVF